MPEFMRIVPKIGVPLVLCQTIRNILGQGLFKSKDIRWGDYEVMAVKRDKGKARL